MTSANDGYNGGAGGKLRKKVLRKTTPYDQPITNPNPKNTSKSSFFSRLIYAVTCAFWRRNPAVTEAPVTGLQEELLTVDFKSRSREERIEPEQEKPPSNSEHGRSECEIQAMHLFLLCRLRWHPKYLNTLKERSQRKNLLHPGFTHEVFEVLDDHNHSITQLQGNASTTNAVSTWSLQGSLGEQWRKVMVPSPSSSDLETIVKACSNDDEVAEKVNKLAMAVIDSIDLMAEADPDFPNHGLVHASN
ncbi:hypothetical protein Tco_0320268 [Tanacetum coccineum]